MQIIATFHNGKDALAYLKKSDAKHINEALQLGIVDYLIKPFQYERFVTASSSSASSKKTELQKIGCIQNWNIVP